MVVTIRTVDENIILLVEKLSSSLRVISLSSPQRVLMDLIGVTINTNSNNSIITPHLLCSI